jgi:hypothetical protein
MDAIMVHLFEAFYIEGKWQRHRTSPTVYGIVKQMAARLWSRASQPWRHLQHLPAENYRPHAARPPRKASGGRASTEAILLVEDDWSAATSSRCCTGSITKSTKQWRRRRRIFAPHQGAIGLLLTDVIMPQMSHFSGYTDDMLALRGVLESNVYLLQKPFAPDELAKKLREVLDAPTVRRADA